MPCSGPDLNEAKLRGEKIEQEMLEKLIKDYRFVDETGLPGSEEQWKKS